MPAPSPDYTKQLDAIAEALKRSPMPGWVVAVISLIVGSLFTLGVQLFLRRWERNRALGDLRRMLYRDIAELFLHVDGIIGLKGLSPQQQLRELKDWLRFEKQAYLNSKPDLYIQLPERGTADFLYLAYRRLLDDAEHEGFHVNGGLANLYVAEAIEQGHLKRKYFRKYMRDQPLLLQTLLTRALELYDEAEERRRSLRPSAGDL